MHEAGAAVLRVAPDKFWEFSAKLFEEQKEYFDGSVVDETRNQTYRRLVGLAGRVGVDEGEVWRLLEVRSGEGNGGNGVTDDVKVMVKVGAGGINRGKAWLGLTMVLLYRRTD